ncbi:hypothetical protein [Bradyrhizobium iriomotense]|uniref:YtkA-like domain-containing protein n=1 Tax=Bradyrhizobium iriomotense TaxID=441950 RepID=A0ABQ6AUT9_9BRAD|nr:hypothetical protein [Bradyrhizobium iriomotense]GLR84991.1 hypothetical protein GCM10007857_17010 [Bradyrhizobium iriomotense]
MSRVLIPMTVRRSITNLALGVVAAVVLISIAAAPTAAATYDESFFTHLHTEKAMANVTISPGRAGPVVITVQLETTDEAPLAAMGVSVRLTNPQAGSAPIEATAEHTSDDQWRATLSVPSGGRWNMGLNIRLSEADEVDLVSPILIN